jgi:uncharacterized membrane protein YbjE (DUF340 family)
MLAHLFWAIFPVIACLLAGFIAGKRCSQAISAHFSNIIALLVWLLLLTIGFEFGEVFSAADRRLKVLNIATSYAVILSCFVFLALWLYARWAMPHTSGKHAESSSFLKPIKECIFALSAVILGSSLFYLSNQYHYADIFMIDSNSLLYLLLLLIGLDSSHLVFDKTWFSGKVLMAPLIVIAASLLAAYFLAKIQHIPLNISLALSSGFGWFSLSGVLVGKQLGSFYGSIALLIDLFRELIGICLLYVAGSRVPTPSIGICGATALDTTLGIIKKTCGDEYIKLAMVSGAVLSLCTPVLILFFLAH